jgi:hypothetical protein
MSETSLGLAVNEHLRDVALWRQWLTQSGIGRAGQTSRDGIPT